MHPTSPIFRNIHPYTPICSYMQPPSAISRYPPISSYMHLLAPQLATSNHIPPNNNPSGSWSFLAPIILPQLELELLGSNICIQSWSWSFWALIFFFVELELKLTSSRLFFRSQSQSQSKKFKIKILEPKVGPLNLCSKLTQRHNIDCIFLIFSCYLNIQYFNVKQYRKFTFKRGFSKSSPCLLS